MRATDRSRTARRSAAGLAAAFAAAGLLAGCGGGAGAASPAWAAPFGAASPAAATAPATTDSDLARGLLPADAFGPATVMPVTLAQLQQHLAAVPGGLATALGGVQVTPAPCATALQTVGAGLAGVTGLAGEGARTGAGGTAEAIVTGTSAGSAVTSLQTLAGACSTVQVTSPHGTATVTLAPADVDVSALGGNAAAVTATAVLTPADRAPVTVSGVLAAVQDDDRLLLLGIAAPGSTAPDHETFTSLLQKAYDAEHALG